MYRQKKFLNYKFFSYFYKKLKIGIFYLSGRNFNGRICVHHRCSGIKSTYFKIDLIRRNNSYGFIYKIFQDINRTSLIGAVIYENGLFCYILLSEGLKIGSKIFSGYFYEKFNINIGSALPIKFFSLFTLINNIENYPYAGSSLLRAAGVSCILVSKSKDKRILKCKSGWHIYLSKNCIGSLGNVSNMKHRDINLKKAGTSFNLGKRPVVRGLAKNACDHPHGGGEGRKSQPSSPRSPWGWLTVGSSTNNKKYQKLKKRKFKNLR